MLVFWIQSAWLTLVLAPLERIAAIFLAASFFSATFKYFMMGVFVFLQKNLTLLKSHFNNTRNNSIKILLT